MVRVIAGNRSHGCVAIRFPGCNWPLEGGNDFFQYMYSFQDGQVVFRTSIHRVLASARACRRLISKKLPRRKQGAAFSHALTTRLTFRGRRERSREKTVFPACPENEMPRERGKNEGRKWEGVAVERSRTTRTPIIRH